MGNCTQHIQHLTATVGFVRSEVVEAGGLDAHAVEVGIISSNAATLDDGVVNVTANILSKLSLGSLAIVIALTLFTNGDEARRQILGTVNFPLTTDWHPPLQLLQCSTLTTHNVSSSRIEHN